MRDLQMAILYKPTKCAFPKLIFQFFNFLIFFFNLLHVTNPRGFLFRKTVLYTVIVWYVLHAEIIVII